MVTRVLLAQRADLQRRDLPGTTEGFKKKTSSNFQEILDRELAAVGKKVLPK
ncbi:MAG TPA: hypothetical protein VN611_04455 [Patescibacteria group bacterium]|nr:hypothetical protein [Patescibacteria group bacterium]